MHATHLNKIRKDHVTKFGAYYDQVKKPAYQCPTVAFQRKVKKATELTYKPLFE